MDQRQRLLVSAIVAAVLFTIGYMIVLVIPGGGDVTDEDFTDYYDSDGRMFLGFVMSLVLLAGCLGLGWFFTEVRGAIEGVLVRVASVASIVGIAAVAGGGAVLAAPGSVQQNSDADFVGVPIAHAFAQAGLGLMVGVGMLSFALATLLVSLAQRRGALIPPWFAWVGVAVSVVMLGSYIWAPGLVFPVWVLVFGVLAWRGQPSRAT